MMFSMRKELRLSPLCELLLELLVVRTFFFSEFLYLLRDSGSEISEKICCPVEISIFP